MQFDGFSVEKWRAQFTGAIDIEETEGLAMRSDSLVVMVVATRIRKSVPEPLDEDGTMRITRQNKIEHLAVLTGDLREHALALLSGTERGFQQALELGIGPKTGDTMPADPAPSYASYAQPAVESLIEVWDGTKPVVPQSGPIQADADGVPLDDIEVFDVPVAEDTSSYEGVVGQVGDYQAGATRSSGGGGGEGPKVGRVSYSDLVTVGDNAPTAGATPSVVGERVGMTRTYTDKALQDFFEEDIQPDE